MRYENGRSAGREDGLAEMGPRTARPAADAGRRNVHEVLAVASRALVLEQVRQHPDGVDTATLAGRTGLHPNTVRFHLDVLAEAGLVTVRSAAGGRPGRPRLRFRPARLAPPPEGPATKSRQLGTSVPPDEAGPDGYALLADILLQHLAARSDPGDAAEAAGRQWLDAGQAAGGPIRIASDAEVVAAVTQLLAEIGFAPETLRDRDGWRILLHRCPFHDAAAEHPEIVCRLHLGLLQGAIDRLGRPADAVRLQPFLAPGLCAVFLPLSALGHRAVG